MGDIECAVTWQQAKGEEDEEAWRTSHPAYSTIVIGNDSQVGHRSLRRDAPRKDAISSRMAASVVTMAWPGKAWRGEYQGTFDGALS
jgi:hypothetical protein